MLCIELSGSLLQYLMPSDMVLGDQDSFVAVLIYSENSGCIVDMMSAIELSIRVI